MKRMITGQGLEEESGETGDQVAGREETEEKEKCERVMTPGDILTEESRKGKETAERSSSEDRGTDIEMEGEHGTEDEETGRQLLDRKVDRCVKGCCPGLLYSSDYTLDYFKDNIHVIKTILLLIFIYWMCAILLELYYQVAPMPAVHFVP